jgi:hypothetical protein
MRITFAVILLVRLILQRSWDQHCVSSCVQILSLSMMVLTFILVAASIALFIFTVTII